jgi:hypothetical protein
VKGTSFASAGVGTDAWLEDDQKGNLIYRKDDSDENDTHYVYYQGQHSLTYQSAGEAREAHLRALLGDKGATLIAFAVC